MKRHDDTPVIDRTSDQGYDTHFVPPEQQVSNRSNKADPGEIFNSEYITEPADVIMQPKTMNDASGEPASKFFHVPFPIDAFPEPLGNFIQEGFDQFGFPPDFLGCSILFAASVAIGNTRRIAYSSDYIQPSILYIALVGESGSGKTPALEMALQPLYEIEHEAADRKRIIVSDTTPEALVSLHAANRRGLGVHHDELMSMINNLNRYNKGSELQFWLSNFNGNPLTVDRKREESVRLPSPSISMIGGLQPGVLGDFKRGKVENGFTFRFAFAYPTIQCGLRRLKDSPAFSHGVREEYKTALNRILDLSGTDDSLRPFKVLHLTDDARSKFRQWQHHLSDQTHIAEIADFAVNMGVAAKLEPLCLRLALVLEMLSYGYETSVGDVIQEESITNAIKLVEYFRGTSLRVHYQVTNPLDKLPLKQRDLYTLLPEKFQRKEIVQLGKTLEISDRTCDQLLTDKQLFQKIEHGIFKKVHTNQAAKSAKSAIYLS